MVVVEGVARSLDPSLNLWTAAEPIAKEWMEANLGPVGRLRKDAREGASEVSQFLAEVPALFSVAERTFVAPSARWREPACASTRNSSRRLAPEDARRGGASTRSLFGSAPWALAAIAARQFLGLA